jgi:hypothetical protein
VAHSWLSQLTFYGLASAEGDGSDGAWALRLFTVVMTAIPFALVWRVWARHARPAVWAVFVFSLALHASASRFQPRPELFTALGLTVLMLFLHRRTAPALEPGGGPAPVRLRRELAGGAALAAVFVVWANAHGGVAVGLAILGVTAVCDLVQDRFDRRALGLALLTVACAAATLMNPFGLSYWEILAPTSTDIFPNIVEWRPVWREPVVRFDRLLALGLLFGLAVASWARGPRRRWAELAWLLGTAAALLTARRHMWLMSLVSLMVIAAHADCSLPRAWGAALGGGGRNGPVPGQLDRGFGLVAAWVGVLLLASWLSADWAPPPARPDRAAEFLRDHAGGRVLNFYEGSSYLQWRLTGNPPLFIDLLNAYPDQVMLDLKEFVLFTPRARRLLDEMQIDRVILTSSVTVPMGDLGLVQFLMRSPDWAVVYRDDAAIIWARRAPTAARGESPR